jgi:hypothetical protein
MEAKSFSKISESRSLERRKTRYEARHAPTSLDEGG